MSDSDVSTSDLAGLGGLAGREAPDEADLSEQSVSEQSADDEREPLLPQDQSERYRTSGRRSRPASSTSRGSPSRRRTASSQT